LIPFYVVGEATAKALAAIGAICGPGPCTPSDIRGGSQTGTSERLAHFILNNLPEREGIKLLYLTGDKNRNTLPKILTERCVTLESLQVYETRSSSTFAKDLESVVKSTPAGNLGLQAFICISCLISVIPQSQATGGSYSLPLLQLNSPRPYCANILIFLPLNCLRVYPQL
jgi:hypothetical protein